MEDRHPVGMSDDLRPIDLAMLLALSHRQRDSTPLSLDQERLLDSWIGGRLPPIDADRAAELPKHNRFAAERILESRLLSTANEGPGVPSTLTARVFRTSRPHNERAADHVPERRLIAARSGALSALAAAPPPPKTATGGIFNLRWPTLSGWQWSGLGAAVAATAVITVFGFQFWQARSRPDQSFQIAMVTIEDRSVLSVGARRTRGPIASTGSESGSYFRDVDVPTGLLQRAIASASTNKAVVEHSDLMNYLRSQNDAFDNQVRILIDSTLADSLSGKRDEPHSIRVRVYDLDDPRTATIRRKIKALQAEAHFILLTLRQ